MGPSVKKRRQATGRFEKPAPDARAAPPEAQQSFISRETGAVVAFTPGKPDPRPVLLADDIAAQRGSAIGGIMIIPTEEALSLAREAGLDLVEEASNEKPSVCRIMDFGKFKYQQNKKLHKTHVHHTKIKEIRLRPKTGEHDIEFKVN